MWECLAQLVVIHGRREDAGALQQASQLASPAGAAVAGGRVQRGRGRDGGAVEEGGRVHCGVHVAR